MATLNILLLKKKNSQIKFHKYLKPIIPKD